MAYQCLPSNMNGIQQYQCQQKNKENRTSIEGEQKLPARVPKYLLKKSIKRQTNYKWSCYLQCILARNVAPNLQVWNCVCWKDRYLVTTWFHCDSISSLPPPCSPLPIVGPEICLLTLASKSTPLSSLLHIIIFTGPLWLWLQEEWPGRFQE